MKLVLLIIIAIKRKFQGEYPYLFQIVFLSH